MNCFRKARRRKSVRKSEFDRCFTAPSGDELNIILKSHSRAVKGDGAKFPKVGMCPATATAHFDVSRIITGQSRDAILYSTKYFAPMFKGFFFFSFERSY